MQKSENTQTDHLTETPKLVNLHFGPRTGDLTNDLKLPLYSHFDPDYSRINETTTSKKFHVA